MRSNAIDVMDLDECDSVETEECLADHTDCSLSLTVPEAENDQSFLSHDLLHDTLRNGLTYLENGASQRVAKLLIAPTNPFLLATTTALGIVAVQTAWLSSTYKPLPLPKHD
eukprot:CAMPEP_0113670848 /NCGR_PEP_ID=MMETSP0038_2-20120614/5373_1 /TAXON_ID=2898 /ORGANISM="Cryptomonas paramecium" /LENGTH=111 /DNA_ID=CAMNT_0000586927 /DNA_START=63 /DNA_END=395 /DNA_ORIENTATION=- /assembly_acc=CAM_ASM_000170